MKNFSTKSWIIGILIGAWIATLIVGFLHGANILTEPKNPLIHTFKDWIIVVIFLLPVSYFIARLISIR